MAWLAAVVARESCPYPYMSKSTRRFTDYQLICWLVVWVLAGCAGYTASVLYTATAQDANALAADFPPHWPSLHALPAIFPQVRWLLTSLALLFGLLGIALTKNLAPSALSRLGWRASGRRAGTSLLQRWQALPVAQRRVAIACFLFLTVVRVVVSWVGVNVDDIASYEYFVRKSLLTVIAYYPAPNNHVLSNVVSWFFYQVYPGYWWSMRLPVLLLSTVGTVGWFLGLLHRTNFRVATLTSIVFGFLHVNLHAAATGRGYMLIMVFSGLGFFCMLQLHSSAHKDTAGWGAWAGAGFVVAGVMGLYAVPTFAYFLVGAYSWLVMQWWRRPTHLLGLGLLAAATLLGAAILYAPLLVISGPAAIFSNVYVSPLTIGRYIHEFPAYVWQTEGLLFGESKNGTLASLHVGSLAAVIVLAGFLVLANRAHEGRLARSRAAYMLHTGMPALWLLLAPYTLLLIQRVQAPERTLAFKSLFMFLLLALQVDWLLAIASAWRTNLRKGVLIGVGVWVGVELAQLYRSNQLSLAYQKTPHLAAQWLLKQPSGPVLIVGSPWYVNYLRFYLHFEAPTSMVVVDDRPRVGVHYRYLIGSPADVPTANGCHLQLHIPAELDYEAADILSCW